MDPLTVRLERLREICLALPESSEKEAWGDPTWRVRNRIFAMQKGNFEGGRPSVWLKAAEDAQPLLVGADPKCFFVPPYVGHKGWVGIYLDTRRVNWAMLSTLIEESHQLVAPRRLTAGAQRRGASAPAQPNKERRAPTKANAGARGRAPPEASSLKRERHPVPTFVRRALTQQGLTAAYRRRPPYQRNDYIGWITSAKREVTRQKRLTQMLDELAGGRLYMNMAWNPPAPKRSTSRAR